MSTYATLPPDSRTRVYKPQAVVNFPDPGAPVAQSTGVSAARS